MSIVIRVEHLGKKYLIRHQQRESYTALRDVIAEKTKKIFSIGRRVDTDNATGTGNREEFWALKDVNFEVNRGDRIGIIGRNGAGKSTLLKVLSRITEPSKGRISIKGRIASLLEVGTGFHPELTGRENIFLNGAILGMHRWEIKKKFDEIVDFSGVEKFLDTPVKRYSSGMYVRLAFAVAAHLESEILVVDEVLAVGDSEFQSKCLGKMQDISRDQGRTILFVSHNMAAISKLCNKGILLNKGTITENSSVDEVIDQYISTNYQSEFYSIGNKDANKDVYFEKIFLSRDKKNTSNSFSLSDDIHCLFEINGNKTVKDSTLTFIVRDKNLNPIFSEHYIFSGCKNLLMATIPNGMLLPGRYYLQSMLHVPNVRFLDNNEEYISFAIEETGSKNSIYTVDLGFVNIPVKWEKV
ncbi:MAG: polysaccharide ABC transporter ATP-binding protein [Chitinophagales bacterium]|nr:polysaccharide ABC transporter ATP-binding protein [Chitinophagales bacterium]